MTDVIKTSDVSAPPSIALALMVKRLVWMRCWGPNARDFGWPLRPRSEYVQNSITCGAEYYRAIDRISAGEAP